MSTSSRIRPIDKHIRAVMLLECKNTAKKLGHQYTIKPTMTPTNARIAAVTSLKTLLEVFEQLNYHLDAILKSATHICDFYDYRRALCERVLPESLFLFEFCRQNIMSNGAATTPLATKVAKLANKVADICDELRLRVNFSLEHHELKFKVLREVQKRVNGKLDTIDEAQPILFSLDVGLPLGIESLQRAPAAPNYEKEIRDLVISCKMVKANLERRLSTLKKNVPLETPSIERRPITPSLRLIRGLKMDRRSSNEIKELTVLPMEPKKVDPTRVAETDSVPAKYKKGSANMSELTSVNMFQEKASYVEVYNSQNRSVSNKENSPFDNRPVKKINSRHVGSQIKPPTLFNTSSIANHRKPIHICEFTVNSNSKIAKPTTITAKPSVSQLRTSSWQAIKNTDMKTHGEVNVDTDKSINSGDSSFDLSDSLITSPYHLSSPSYGSFNETPLARKSGAMVGKSDLCIPRRRPLRI